MNASSGSQTPWKHSVQTTHPRLNAKPLMNDWRPMLQYTVGVLSRPVVMYGGTLCMGYATRQPAEHTSLGVVTC